MSGVLCIPDKKKVHRLGGFFGFVGMIIYALLVNNPFLVLYDTTIARDLAILFNWDMVENFLL